MQHPQKPVILFDIDFTLFDTASFQRKCIWRLWSLSRLFKECVYPDVVPTLRALGKKTTLGIFSQALTGFQKLKIEYSGLSPFFDKKHIYISRNKKTLAPKLFPTLDIRSVAVVDDREDVANVLLPMGVKVFFLDRTGNKTCPRGAIPVQSLYQLITLSTHHTKPFERGANKDTVSDTQYNIHNTKPITTF